ncbi:MAG: transketolase [Bacteroidota bacterium]|nr:transketolase [Bacteroidota bacterium]
MDSKTLTNHAYEIRRQVLISLNAAGSGHLGGSLGLADIFTVLFFDFLRHKPDNPEWENRDRLVLSIGHVAPVLYASLAEAGYFPKSELLSLRKLGSRLQGHPATAHHTPGLETSAGSLGQGLSIAVGMALSDKIDKKNRRVISIHGDGELQEGSIWEAAMSAAHYKLNNLIAIIDRNYLQIDGKTEDVMQIEPLQSKWESFGWNVISCNGNSIPDIQYALNTALQSDKPSAIIAKTRMGAGVKAIENNHKWHGKVPNDELLTAFLKALGEN